MTQSDRWNTRKPVADYYLYKDLLNIEARKQKFQLEDTLNIRFYIPMPKSWGFKKRQDMDGRPHQDKPDIDNLLKGFMDALSLEDKNVWSVVTHKYWGEDGMIVISGSNDEIKVNLPSKYIKRDQNDLAGSSRTHDLRLG